MNKPQADSNHQGLRTQYFRSIPDDLELLLNKNLGMSYRCLSRFPWPMDFVSSGCKAISGYDAINLKAEQLGWGHIVHPDDLAYVKKLVGDAVSKDQSFEVEYRIRTCNGVEKWVWDRGYPTRADDGKSVVLEGFVTDITDRKQAEISLNRKQAYLTAILEAAIEGVISVSEEGCIETLNPAAQTIFGYPLDELEGVDFRVLMSAKSQEEYTRYLTQCLGNTEPKTAFHAKELIARKKDGSMFPIQLSVSEVQHQSRRLFVCLIRDISLQRHAEDEAREHRDKLARVDRLNLLGEMASGIAHEINQPLTAISLFSQVGKRYIDTQQYHRLPEIFDKLIVHAQRAGTIIENMQNMAREHDSVRQAMDCNDMVEEVVSLAEAESRIRNIPIEIQLGECLPTVLGDKVQIQQVLLNLLRNGMESMVSAHCRAGDAIRLSTQVNGSGDVEVIVTDLGSGVAEDVAEQLFKPFSTTKQKGLGMGLSISRAIVLAHGGQLSFSNNTAGGATFLFSLPGIK